MWFELFAVSTPSGPNTEVQMLVDSCVPNEGDLLSEPSQIHNRFYNFGDSCVLAAKLLTNAPAPPVWTEWD